MIKLFVIKCAKPKDPFYMKETGDYIYLYARGYTDLSKVIRLITPRGYRVRKARWFSMWFKKYPIDLELKNPFFLTTMFVIRTVDKKPTITKSASFTNSFNYTHTINLTNAEAFPDLSN